MAGNSASHPFNSWPTKETLNNYRNACKQLYSQCFKYLIKMVFIKIVFLNISNCAWKVFSYPLTTVTKYYIVAQISYLSIEILLLVIYCVAKLQLDQDGVKTGLVLQPYSQSVVTNSHPGHLQFYDIKQNKLWLEVCDDENSSRTLPWANSIICVSVRPSVCLCKL